MQTGLTINLDLWDFVLKGENKMQMEDKLLSLKIIKPSLESIDQSF